MKFSEISKEQWETLQPYLDTCLLPVTALNGMETPYEATEALEKLRDFMLHVEVPFKGRIVTYPAYHFYVHTMDQLTDTLNELCRRLRKVGFRYIVLMSHDRKLANLTVSEADLLLVPEEEEQEQVRLISEAIQKMWQS